MMDGAQSKILPQSLLLKLHFFCTTHFPRGINACAQLYPAARKVAGDNAQLHKSSVPRKEEAAKIQKRVSARTVLRRIIQGKYQAGATAPLSRPPKGLPYPCLYKLPRLPWVPLGGKQAAARRLQCFEKRPLRCCHSGELPVTAVLGVQPV